MTVLEQELQFFEENKAKWLKVYAGKFVLVKGTELIGVFDTAETAIAEGAQKYGTESFLVRKVTPEEESVRIPALTLGLLHAVTA